MEKWVPILECEGNYLISNLGRVKSLSRKNSVSERIMKLYQEKKGYMRCALMVKGKQVKFLVHVLVAKYFIPNPMNLPIVNHKDENKRNNSCSNLEWCTHLYNKHYGSGIERQRQLMINNNKLSMKIIQTDMLGNIINEWPSQSEASRALKIRQSGISCCVRGGRDSYRGYKWIKLIKD